jgi:hypothetical protein
MFEKISRLKLRFDSGKGLLSVEDLWDLPLSSEAGKVNLDSIAVSLYNELKNESTVSFVSTVSKAKGLLQLKFDAVKHILDTRLAENAIAANARVNAAKKQDLLALIARKEGVELESKSLDDLKAMVAAL